MVLLDVPPAVSKKLVRERAKQGGSMDIHEQHSAYLEKCCDAYQVLCETYDWLRISCMADGRLRSADDISKEVLDAVLSRLG